MTYTALDFAERYLLRGGSASTSSAYDISADDNITAIELGVEEES